MRSAKVFLFLCLLGFSFCGDAQKIKKPFFNLGVSAGTSDAFRGFMPGADLRLSISGNKPLLFNWFVASGYTHLDGMYTARYVNANSINTVTYSYIDLLALKGGARFFVAPNFYIAADAGIALPVGSKITDATFMNIYPDSTSMSKTGKVPALRSGFVYSPSVGITPGKHWDLSVKYENFGRYRGQFAFRAGYNL